MPYYEYYCERNDSVVEVRHGMTEMVETWGELCERAGQSPGETDRTSPVRRLMSVPAPTPGAPSAPMGCGAGCACARPD